MKRLLLFIVLYCMVASSALCKNPWVQSQGATSDNQAVAYMRNVTAGNTLIVAVSFLTQSGTASISDTLTTTYTLAQGANSAACFGPWDNRSYIWYGVASSSGANTVTPNVTAGTRIYMTVHEFTGVWTYDNGVTDAWASVTTSMTSSAFATAQNGELIVASSGQGDNSQIFSANSDMLLYGLANDIAVTTKISGQSGNYTATQLGTYGNCVVMATAAFTPASFNITTPALLNAEKSVAFSQTLASEGGVGAVTWDLSSGSLPSGITLSSAGVLSGTTAINGPHSITARVTDSLAATATKALTFSVGTTQNTISLVQSKQCSSTNCTSFSSNFTAGNIVHVTLGAGSYTAPTDVLGTTYSLVCAVSKSFNRFSTYTGTVGSTGAQTVSWVGTADAVVSEFTGSQAVPDACIGAVGFTNSGTITSGNLTTTANNEYVAVSGGIGGSGLCLLTADSPFTATVAGNNQSKTETKTEATQGAYAGTFTVSGGACSAGYWGIDITGFHPTLQDFTPTPMGHANVPLMQ